MCYCEHCRENFKRSAGSTCRGANGRAGRNRRASITDWQQQRLLELYRLWDGEIRKINPAARLLPQRRG